MKKEQYATPKANTVPHYDAQALGNTIRVLRENLQLTQTELGTLSSFSTAEISKLETGARKKIPIESLIRIAPHLNVSLDYLLVQCILDYKSDHEQFYDYNGNEIDLYQIARNIYTVDSSLLLIFTRFSCRQGNDRMAKRMGSFKVFHRECTRKNKTFSKNFYGL